MRLWVLGFSQDNFKAFGHTMPLQVQTTFEQNWFKKDRQMFHLDKSHLHQAYCQGN